ncbi:uncharacterized protein BT62DRAFT_935833 [Guyanagaster necrorhizus]|uniref:Uncharacterized protein n=1 Tax=Guyanagaster necrorhizus TaxID=856835 RepID=A0A9P8APG8_9AGAR|nr:uncharacterized protein BT62DRAFT_935833 [Guyanagaster necrorhizus MCA 3950]KAG7442791.1 hypothetical protein BT62DRAFT_935833 [Guyanagaster necrorhizus MCA 3950]
MAPFRSWPLSEDGVGSRRRRTLALGHRPLSAPIPSTIPILEIRTAFYWLAMLVSTVERVCSRCGRSLIPQTKNAMLNISGSALQRLHSLRTTIQPHTSKIASCFYLRFQFLRRIIQDMVRLSCMPTMLHTYCMP